MFFLILFILLSVVSLSIVGFSLYTGISPMPSSRKAATALLVWIPKEARVIYELGSGWGGLARKIAENHPNAQVKAFEISFFPWLVSVGRQKVWKRQNLTIYRCNFFSHPLHDADTVVCYLFPKAMERLRPKFEKELLKGVRVLSNAFAVPHWRADQIIPLNDVWKSEVFVYHTKKSPHH